MKRHYASLDTVKFIFALLIMVYHGIYVVDLSEVIIFPIGGYIAVDLFFMISGFLMVCSAKHSVQSGMYRLDQSVNRFIYGKIKSIYPYFFFAFLVSFIVTNIRNGASGVNWLKNILYSVWDLLLLNRAGVAAPGWVGGVWYISAMLIAMLLIYPLLIKNTEVYLSILAPIIVILYLGYFSTKYGYIHITWKWNGIMDDAVLRAIGGLNIGCLVYAAARKMRTIRFTSLGKRFLLLLALLGYSFVLISCCLRSKGPLDFIWLLSLAVSLILTIVLEEMSEKSPQKKNVIFSLFLRKYSITIYLNQLVCAFTVKKLFPDIGPLLRLSVYFAATLLLALLSIVVIDFVKKHCFNRIKVAFITS